MVLTFPGIEEEEPINPKEIVAHVWVCDMGHHYHFMATHRFIRQLRTALATVGITLTLKEEKIVPDCDVHQHKIIAVLRSAHTVQGLEWEAGESPIHGLELLIAKYVDLKNGRGE